MQKILMNTESLIESLGAVSLKVNNDIKTLSVDSAASHEKTRQEIAGLSSKMGEFSSMSTSQHESLLAKLEQLEHQITTPAHPDADKLEIRAKTRDDIKEEAHRKAALEANESEAELKASLQRLYLLARKKEKTAFSAEAQNIIDDLDKILNVVSQKIGSPDLDLLNGHTRKRKRRYCVIILACLRCNYPLLLVHSITPLYFMYITTLNSF